MMPRFKKHSRAQTAMELAVFGAILIFVVSVIVRQAMSASYAQNQYLRAMRQAMSTSFRYSEGLMGGGDIASHNTTSILFVEDRLTADSAKYGAIDRTPYIVSGSATNSRNLFMPVDAGDDEDLPIFDMFINGKHFPFRVARFKSVNLAQSCRGVGPFCPGECTGVNPCAATSVQFFPGDNFCRDSCNPAFCNAAAGECAATSIKTWPMPWVANCVKYTGLCEETCLTSGCTTCCNPGAGDCVVGSGVSFEATIGCAQLYGIIFNHQGFAEWCDGAGKPCPLCPGPGCNFSADERFDLDRDGIFGALDDPDEPDGAQRVTFAWQWYSVLGVDETEDYPLGWGSSGSSALIGRGEGIVIESMDCEEDCAEQRNTSVDMDGDLKREHIMADTKQVDAATGIIKQFTYVMDNQDGDLDFTRGNSDAGPDPGMTRNTKMYTRVLNGTYLLIEEGNLYGDGLQYIRTTQKKDQIDLIEREIQLSNDTDRFCDRNGNVTAVGSPDWGEAGWNASIPNPVEACNNCLTAGNLNLTCMDEDPKGDGTQPPIIFVRSRVVDARGRKWITETTSDPYVEFVVPKGP